ncbi:MAG TPA: ribose-5-phosphate isomerase RpiA [Tepidisphaeraceae bacterium]|nr:ribose-5-phosphate isomerase RpiA [Tepidisphaeraceae bacterium]
MTAKQLAGQAALRFIHSDMLIGLGTGSTADCFLVALAEAIKSGKLKGIRGIPTSQKSDARARELGIPVVGFAQNPRASITVDGADEVGPDLNLIKGLGGALLREKVVAQNSDKLVIIADAGKEVPVLGTKSALPIEVTIFGHETQPAFFRSLGCEPTIRPNADGTPFITDNGNYIFDCRFPSIPDPVALESTLMHRAGIVETGLFIGIAKVALIADGEGVRERTK